MKFSIGSMSGGEMFATAAKWLVALVVLVYLGLQSINFFQFTFPPEQEIYSWLGFGLTGGGLIAYLLILKFGAKKRLDKIVAVVMLALCAIGELATAGFGMQVEVFVREARHFTDSELQTMIWIVRGLAGAHAIALILMAAGEEVVEAFGRDESAVPAKDAPAPRVVASHPLVISSPKPVVNQDSGGVFTD